LPGLATGWQNDISPEPYNPINPGEEINVDWAIVSSDFFDTMRIPILQGRAFTSQESESEAKVVLVDENLARQFWPDGDALGKHIKYNGPMPHEIIGIVGNVKHYGSEALPRIKIYTPLGWGHLNNATLSLRLTGADTPAILEAVTREVQSLEKDLPVTEVATFDEILVRVASPRRFNTVLLSLFAAIALLLAAVGIYGVMSYTVVQRTHEVGIRLALGAQVSDVLRLVVGEVMKLVVIGTAIGLVSAFALTQLMRSILYKITATDPQTFSLISLLLLVVALVACYIPARRATRVDPMEALRQE
jgi:ABC-type antimicrobial peptide transport system, permease component